MKFIQYSMSIACFAFILFSCDSGKSFEEQVIEDIQTKMGTGICDAIPAGSIIKNVVLAHIEEIKESKMTDVSYTYDFEHNGKTDSRRGAILYMEKEGKKVLASIGGCDYDME